MFNPLATDFYELSDKMLEEKFKLVNAIMDTPCFQLFGAACILRCTT